MAYKRSLKNKKVLVTCGPTWVPIDSVRVISNISSGEMGQSIAEQFQKAGAKVTLLEGPVTANKLLKNVKIKKFTYFRELQLLLQEELSRNYDVVIHAAAVSDYRVKKPANRKITSSQANQNIALVKNPKLINSIKKRSKDCLLVGFKLLDKVKPSVLNEACQPLIKQARCDLIVVNAFNKNTYQGLIVDHHLNIQNSSASKSGLVKNLIKQVKEQL